MYYPSSKDKGADQLRGYREADLRLCFRLCRLLVFPWGGSNTQQKAEVHRIILFSASQHKSLQTLCSLNAMTKLLMSTSFKNFELSGNAMF